MTDFFERQNTARRKTKLLLCYFLPSVMLMILGIYFIALIWLAFHPYHYHWHDGFERNLIHPTNIHWPLFGVVGAVTALIVTLAALHKAQLLGDGGPAVAAMLGARRVLPNTMDPDERRLRNVVEEMSIASGVPVPEIFLLEDEDCINAFVAGHNTSDAALGVTNGALRLLNRDELQAVVGHEFSHLLNGDMGLNLWLMSFLYGIQCIALAGKGIMEVDCDRSYRRNSRGSGGIILIGGALFAVGSLGYFFGRLIKCAVCREREYLADAAAVQFTRNPIALASALKKIGGLASGSRIIGAEADEASHLFFSDVMPESGMFSTHPSLIERIRLLDPSFNGRFEHVQSLPPKTPPDGKLHPIKTIMDIPGVTRLPPAALLQVAEMFNETRAQQQPVPKPKFTPQHLTFAAGLRASIPPELAAAAREPFGANALIYAMLLLPDTSARAAQLNDIGPVAQSSLMNAAQQYFSTVCTLSNGQKLALINLAMPSLRQLSQVQFEEFSSTIKKLVESDSQISLFEYSLQKTLLRHLAPVFSSAKPSIAQIYAAAGLAPECGILLSALAYESSAINPEISAAFQAGADSLDFPPNKQIALLPRDQCNLAQIDSAVQKITQAALPVKRQILNACALVVACDSLVKEEEAEMLRAIADAIGCPLPPFVSAIGIPETA